MVHPCPSQEESNRRRERPRARPELASQANGRPAQPRARQRGGAGSDFGTLVTPSSPFSTSPAIASKVPRSGPSPGPKAQAAQSARSTRTPVGDDPTPESVGVSSPTLEAIASCESGGDPTVVSADGAYRGKYQFDYGTWASVGGSGDRPPHRGRAGLSRRAALCPRRLEPLADLRLTLDHRVATGVSVSKRIAGRCRCQASGRESVRGSCAVLARRGVRWRAGTRSRGRYCGVGSRRLAVAIALFCAVWVIRRWLRPTPRRSRYPASPRSPPWPACSRSCFGNSLVLALHGFACVAGFIAGRRSRSPPSGAPASRGGSTKRRGRWRSPG